MRAKELLRLVGLNINQNKFKSVMTSIGIVVGAATIVLVIGIGRGGQMEVAEQFAELNAGAIDVSYEYEGDEAGAGGGSFFENMGEMFGGLFGGMPGGMNGGMPGEMNGGANGGAPGEMNGGVDGGVPGEMNGGADGGAPGEMNGGANGGMPGEMNGGANGGAPGEMNGGADGGAPGDMNGEMNGGMPGGEMPDGEMPQGERPNTPEPAEEMQTEPAEEAQTETEHVNEEKLILTQDDVEDIKQSVEGIGGATISYSTRASVEGADLTSAQAYTVAGVKESYASVSKLTMKEGSFLTEADDEAKNRVCVLGATAAKELFGSDQEAVGSIIYIEDRMYTIAGILNQTATVSAGISPDTSIFIPYQTGIKYVTGEDLSPVITVIAEDVNVLNDVIESVRQVMEEKYPEAEFTFEDSGSKMQAAQASNRTLTMLLSAMAAIVFLVGGIGIMNVLFVSVKERTNEIGILKAIGMARGTILMEFLIESSCISFIGGVLGVLLSFGVLPVAERFDVRVEVTLSACLTALGFAVMTGTLFGIYPAWKASRLEPVEALNAE